MKYYIWAITRLAKRMLAYIIILPVLLALYPFTTIGNALGNAFYKLKKW